MGSNPVWTCTKTYVYSKYVELIGGKRGQLPHIHPMNAVNWGKVIRPSGKSQTTVLYGAVTPLKSRAF